MHFHFRDQLHVIMWDFQLRILMWDWILLTATINKVVNNTYWIVWGYFLSLYLILQQETKTVFSYFCLCPGAGWLGWNIKILLIVSSELSLLHLLTNTVQTSSCGLQLTSSHFMRLVVLWIGQHKIFDDFAFQFGCQFLSNLALVLSNLTKNVTQ